jgi:hypothetical protein
VDDPFKRLTQLFFRTHSALPGRRWSPDPLAVAPFGESHDSRPVSMGIFVRCSPRHHWLLCPHDMSMGRQIRGTHSATRASVAEATIGISSRESES